MTDFFKATPIDPPLPLMGVFVACRNDPFPGKINLTVGAYRTEEAQPLVLQSVREAEDLIHKQELDHEYLEFMGQNGHPGFVSAAQKLMFGDDSKLLTDGLVYSLQTVGGTGSVRLAMEFLRIGFPDSTLYLPDVTWPNHILIHEACGLQKEAKTYRYLDAAGTGFNFDGMIEDLKACPERSVILLHSCAHNPTGVDPTDEEWDQILQVMKERNLFPLFDNAYQGFVSGDPIVDAYAVRAFANAGMNLIAACSFSKNFGLYGQRLGCVHVVTSNVRAVEAVGSHLRTLTRALWSNCPSHGARIVSTILNDPVRKAAWLEQVAGMANRLNSVRRLLYDSLVSRNVKGTWEHVIKQRGMFSYTGLSLNSVTKLRVEHHIYMLNDGRITLAGLNTRNIDQFADALLAVLGTN